MSVTLEADQITENEKPMIWKYVHHPLPLTADEIVKLLNEMHANGYSLHPVVPVLTTVDSNYRQEKSLLFVSS